MGLIPMLLLVLSISTAAGERPEISLPAEEQEAAYAVLEMVNPTVDWRTLYPGDLCLSGPHGLVCDVFPNSSFDGGATTHVVELSFGFLSDFSANPKCSPNATLSNLPLSSFPFLRRLFFYSCFSQAEATLPENLWNISASIEELVFIQNPSVVGHLSGTLGKFSRLRRLIFSGTSISGKIPGQLGDLQESLEELDLSKNRLEGYVTSSIGRLENLKVLDLSANRLIGPIPPEIGQLGELVKLDLSSNRLSGSVAVELNRLVRLEFLDLSYNNLTGGVPSALEEMVTLREVHLSSNPLGGHIPEIWEKLGSVSALGLSNTRLVGKIPNSMGVFLERLFYLALDNNFLTGELPEQFKRLERTAGEIKLQNNALEGRIPFSAAFVFRMGGELKLDGNPKLCIEEYETRGNFVNLPLCPKNCISKPALLYSVSSSCLVVSAKYVFLLYFLLAFLLE